MQYSIPWIEKYRPKNISDIVLDNITKRQIDIFVSCTNDAPLIITGVPGIGKTTSGKCIASMILQEDINTGYLELNAADERGARSIASIIPPFCKKAVNYHKPKIILLDEADNLTSKCQNDIVRLIKEYGKDTKFIFTCNDSSKIIQNIQSICRIIRYKKLSVTQVKSRLVHICEKENIAYDDDALDTIFSICEGDLRKAINDLQKTAFSFGIITKITVLSVCKVPDPAIICEIVDLCFDKNIEEANKKLDGIIREGYYYSDIISGFTNVLSSETNITENIRTLSIDAVNQTKMIISNGVRSKLQLTAMIAKLVLIAMQNN